MAKYETLPTISFQHGPFAHPIEPPAVVHLNDPALSVMIDFKYIKYPTITPESSIDHALNELKVYGVHLVLVIDKDQNVIGLISSEDILGEKPIKLLEERRIEREEILVKMVMMSESDIVAFDIEALRLAKVGNVLNTLRELHQHYALVIKHLPDEPRPQVRGLFSLSQISKQLHMDVGNSISQADTLAELQKRHSR